MEMSTAKNPYIKSKANGKENSQQGRPVPKEQGKQAQKKDADKKRKEPVWMWGRSTQGEEKKEEGVDKTRKEEWQYRPVVLKKFKPDPVMTQFFTVVKSKKATHHHNHQGFPKKQCWFAANLDDYYYVNPEYVEKYPMVVKMYKEDGLYIACRYCKLGPCVREGIRWLIVKYCEKTLKDYEKCGAEALLEMRYETEKMMCYTMGQAFGKPDYTRPIYSHKPAPECTRNFILNYFLHARPELREGISPRYQVELPHDDDMFQSDYTRPESKNKNRKDENQTHPEDDRCTFLDNFEPEGGLSQMDGGLLATQPELEEESKGDQESEVAASDASTERAQKDGGLPPRRNSLREEEEESEESDEEFEFE